MKKEYAINNSFPNKEFNPFVAPTEQIEQEIVEFCINELGLPFGEFWYAWFTSNKDTNATVHINCDVDEIKDVKEKFSKLSFIDSIFKYVKCPTDGAEFKFQYFIHFKIKQL